MSSDGITLPRIITIGSSSGNDLVFRAATVSGTHARLYWSDAQSSWMLDDLGSTNGTFLRGERLEPGVPIPVKPGDEIYLGKTFHFELTHEHLGGDEGALLGPDLKPRETAAMPAVGSSRRDRTRLDQTRTTAEEGTPDEPDPTSSDQSDQTDQTDQTDRTAPPSAQATSATAPLGPVSTMVLDPSAFADQAAEGTDAEAPQLGLRPPDDAPWISIGYADDNAVRVRNPAVSGHHAQLYRLGDGFLLEDQGSTNGTWYQGRRIHRVRLGPEARFRVANHGLSVAELLPYFDRATGELAPPTTAELDEGAEPILVGRAPDCDIRLDAPMVSARHIRLSPLPGGVFRLEDLESTNGTYLNSRDNRVNEATVGSSDVVFLGSYRLPISRVSSLVSGYGGDEAVEIPTDKRVLVVGRDETCDVVIDAPQVSRRHAELVRLPDGGFEVRDLGSINGTYVNGLRVKNQRVTSNDLISFASYRVRLDESGGLVHRDYHGDIMLQAERISVRVKDRRAPDGHRTIVDDASFTAYPTEFVGLMGPSGAGKTTLMLALNGYTPPSAGRSLLNGHDLYTNYNSFRGNIGYVPQDDIIYRELTVYESLYYTARLRLPPDTTDEEIEAKIDAILENLEIQQTKHVLIGDALKKGISGGQRKRVNLAQELITEPSLLFLDEPTSGLASEDTINVMNLLRRLADEGRTILLTIHQPSLEAYRKLDNVIYLFHGRLVYYGPAYPDGISYFYPEVRPDSHEGQQLLADPGNALKALAEDQRDAMEAEQPWEELETVVEDRRHEFLRSPHYQDYVYDRAVAPEEDVRLQAGNKQKTQRRGWLRQWWILSRRCATIKRKDLVNTTILLMQAPIIGLVLYLVFAGRVGSYFENLSRGPAALFLLVASAVWFGCSNSAREIVSELPIYRRERMVNLMIPSYVLSKFAVLGVVCAVQCAVLLAIVYPALGYSGNLLAIYLLLLAASLAGVGMGLTLSAVVRSSEAAMALVPLLLIPQIILGGIIMPIHELSPAMNVVSTAMISRWGFEGMLHLEYRDDGVDDIQQACGIDLCPDPLNFDLINRDPDADEEMTQQSFFPAGPGQDHEICNVLCANVRGGLELAPLERAFGLNLNDDGLRERYRDAYGVGTMGAQSSLVAVYVVLSFFVLLFFALVCAVLRWKDVEVG